MSDDVLTVDKVLAAMKALENQPRHTLASSPYMPEELSLLFRFKNENITLAHPATWAQAFGLFERDPAVLNRPATITSLTAGYVVDLGDFTPALPDGPGHRHERGRILELILPQLLLDPEFRVRLQRIWATADDRSRPPGEPES